MVFGFSYQWIGLRREAGRLRLLCVRCDDAHRGGVEIELANRAAATAQIYLRVSVTDGARCQFAFSTDGAAFTGIGPAFSARSSYWVGAKVGLFAQAAAEKPPPGHADFDWFRVSSLSP